MWLSFRHLARRTGEDILTFPELIPNCFGDINYKISAKILFRSKLNEISNAVLISLQWIRACHFLYSLSPHMHPPHPLSTKTLKTLNTTVVHLGHAILKKISTRGHGIINRAHKMIYREHLK